MICLHSVVLGISDTHTTEHFDVESGGPRYKTSALPLVLPLGSSTPSAFTFICMHVLPSGVLLICICT